MGYLTESFHSKIVNNQKIGNHSKIDEKCCIDELNNELNKWLAKPDHQDVKVDNRSFAKYWVNITDYRMSLIILYHHE